MPKSSVLIPKGTRPIRFALRECREALGVSQAELARRIGVPPVTLYAMETGRIRKINLEVLAACVAELNRGFEGVLEPGDLFKFLDVGPGEK